MESLVDSQHGSTALIAGLVIILALHLVMKVGEMVFEIYRDKNKDSKNEITEISMALRQNTDAVRELRVQISFLQQELEAVKKLKIDTDKLFSIVKESMPRKKWQSLRKIAEDVVPPK